MSQELDKDKLESIRAAASEVFATNPKPDRKISVIVNEAGLERFDLHMKLDFIKRYTNKKEKTAAYERLVEEYFEKYLEQKIKIAKIESKYNRLVKLFRSLWFKRNKK